MIHERTLEQTLDFVAGILERSSSLYGKVSMIQVRHNKRMGTEDLSVYHPNLLWCLDQMLAVIKLSQHIVSSSKTVRPIIPLSAQCVVHFKIMWSAVCSLAPHSHFALQRCPFVIASHDLPFVQKIHLYSHYVSIVIALWILIVSWIQPKELACTAHTMLFQRTKRQHGQIHTLEMILNSFVFYHHVLNFHQFCFKF